MGEGMLEQPRARCCCRSSSSALQGELRRSTAHCSRPSESSRRARGHGQVKGTLQALARDPYPSQPHCSSVPRVMLLWTSSGAGPSLTGSGARDPPAGGEGTQGLPLLFPESPSCLSLTHPAPLPCGHTHCLVSLLPLKSLQWLPITFRMQCEAPPLANKASKI